jgi:excisionase family DNA binding protein
VQTSTMSGMTHPANGDGEPVANEVAVPPITTVVGKGSEDALPLALTVQETSDVLRLDPRTIRAMLRAGELDGNQKGHAIRISRSSVLDWLRGKRRVPRSKR